MEPVEADEHGGPVQVHVSVEGVPFEYQLTEEDLRVVFSRYGSVTRVQCNQWMTGGIITFKSTRDASCAVADLNGKPLGSVQGYLRVTWFVPGNEAQAKGGGAAAAAAAGWTAAGPPGLYLPVGPGYVQPDKDHTDDRVRKYTCRFDIGITNEKAFQVARRIIGTKGANMKRVVKMSDAKLRLRGRGSGFLEGAQKVESAEPLHLCVSCKEYNGYQVAIKEVGSLLQSVYTDYLEFCHQRGRKAPDLRVVMREHPLPGSREQEFQDPRAARGSPASVLPSLAAHTPFPPTPTPWNAAYPMMYGAMGPAQALAMAVREEPGENQANLTPEVIQQLINDRNEARRVCNFAEADRIRNYLRDCGVALMDEPGGRGPGSEVTTWRYWRQ